MAVQSRIIEEGNISEAWAQTFLRLMHEGVPELSPLVAKITLKEPTERLEIRKALDSALRQAQLKNCHTVANTLFPTAMWNPELPRSELYSRYKRALPRIKHYGGNQYGTYFGRLIAFQTATKGDFNQLDHIIETYGLGNHRRSALQASVFDPGQDHTHQRRRGFPCLQQLVFSPVGKQGLNIMAVYAIQYVFDKAYGNYLGLYRLGNFMAHEMGLHLQEITCVACTAQLGNVSKNRLQSLTREIQSLLSSSKPMAA
jgi:thymidylate synthase